MSFPIESCRDLRNTGMGHAEAMDHIRAEKARRDGKKAASIGLDNDATETANRFARIAKRRK